MLSEGDNYELGLKYASGSQEFYATAFLLLMENEIIYDSDGVECRFGSRRA